jgi:hypothetical protein
MLNNNVYYHGTVRKAIVAFGNLFSNIYIDRKQGDSVTGDTVQRLQIPLAYAPKEKWIVRLDSDPNLEGHTYTTLPRLSFEIIGYNYDSSRKTVRLGKISQQDSDSSKTSVYAPVPYNLDISMYILTKNQEDGLQIIEQILPTFTPEYTLSINAVPGMDIVNNVPIILNSVSVSDEYDGDFQTRRFVTHTLNFQMKLHLYGPILGQNVIEQVITSIGANEDFSSPNRIYTAVGDNLTQAVVNQTWLDGF